jgi:4-diphosphocytidyl-2-C-methyl-D-erythritol kinase
MKIEARAYAKINWLLEVGGVRPDGYHELCTLFQTIDLYDELVIESEERLLLEIEGNSLLETDESNLVLRAARALLLETGQRDLGARIFLKKQIPLGAGLGGGSSDAATTLLALNELWGCRFDRGRLAAIGARIGSDVPIFLTGGTAWGRGRGTEIEPVRDVEAPYLLLVNPRIEVSTASAYRAFDELTGDDPPHILTTCSFLTDDQMFTQTHNSLAGVVGKLYPEVAAVEERLKRLGGEPVLMSGSGATVWARFTSGAQLSSAATALENADWLIIKTRALGRDEYWGSILTAI